MRSFTAFFKKELLESARGWKLLLLGILFVAFGIMNPTIAKLTPWLMETLSDDLASTGMTLTAVTVDALSSWTQFFKNIPMLLIALVLLWGNTFTKEYRTGTLILMLTKGLARFKVLLAKTATVMLIWSAGYWLCFGVTYACNAYFWDNSIAIGLMPAAVNWWLFGMFVISLMILCSVLAKNEGIVLLATGGGVLVSYLVGLLPKLSPYFPTALMNSAKLLVGLEHASDYRASVLMTVILCVLCIVAAIPIFNKKQL